MPQTRTEIDILLKARADLAALKTAKGEIGGITREIKASNDSLKSFASFATQGE